MESKSSLKRDEHALRRGLEQWRLRKLQAIEEDMLELTEDLRAAQEGLGIAHRNPGEIAQNVLEYLWEMLNRSAMELERLEKEHQGYLEMDLPRLIVEYKQKRKEPPRWAFLRF